MTFEMPALGDGIAHEDDAVLARLGRRQRGISFPEALKIAEIDQQLHVVRFFPNIILRRMCCFD